MGTYGNTCFICSRVSLASNALILPDPPPPPPPTPIDQMLPDRARLPKYSPCFAGHMPLTCHMLYAGPYLRNRRSEPQIQSVPMRHLIRQSGCELVARSIETRNDIRVRLSCDAMLSASETRFSASILCRCIYIPYHRVWQNTIY